MQPSSEEGAAAVAWAHERPPVVFRSLETSDMIFKSYFSIDSGTLFGKSISLSDWKIPFVSGLIICRHPSVHYSIFR